MQSETIACEQCGTDFVAQVEKGRPRRFCSRACSAEAQKISKLKGREVPCGQCSATFYAKRSELSRGGGRYCSPTCARAALGSPAKRPGVAAKIAETKRGAKNPMWRGADTEGSIYRVFSVRLKGETCCRNCGRSDMVLHLHHAVPRSMCKAGRRDLRNGVTLCAACHTQWHHRTITIYRDVFTEEEWTFISSLELLGQSITAWLDDRYPERAPVERAA